MENAKIVSLKVHNNKMGFTVLLSVKISDPNLECYV